MQLPRTEDFVGLTSRRAFLGKCTTAAAVGAATGWGFFSEWTAGASAAQPAVNPHSVIPDTPLTLYEFTSQIWIRWRNINILSYRVHPTQKYPYFYPVAGPVSGLSLTTESSLPWPHQRSLFFACDRVNGCNFWQTELQNGQIVSDGPKATVRGDDTVELTDACRWLRPGAEPIARDERRFTLRIVHPRLRLIDAWIKWSAVVDLKVEKTNHSLFSVRAAPDITPLQGGALLNDLGDEGEKGTFGKKAAWCCFFGRRAGLPEEFVEGIALFDHPKNPWSPSPWFTRDYGFISPTPLNFIERPWTLSAGQSVEFRYRVALFGGDAKAAGLAELYRTWVEG